jgi:hypothetical protein
MANDDLDLPSPDQDESGPYALVGSARAKPGRAPIRLKRGWSRSLGSHGKSQARSPTTSTATGLTVSSSSSMRPGAASRRCARISNSPTSRPFWRNGRTIWSATSTFAGSE